MTRAALLVGVWMWPLLFMAGCARDAGVVVGDDDPAAGVAHAGVNPRAMDAAPVEPPPAIRAWMDRLTIEHSYDPETGFIVARETIGLPAVLDEGPRLEEALARSRESGRLLVAFATADRCAPCQQYKKDALNDPAVIAVLADTRLIATHVEVDREGEAADAILGGRGIPMTYAMRDGRRVGMLRGQRSAAELLAWLDSMLEQ